MNNILITGVAGAIGSNLLRTLRKTKSYNIIGVDNLSSSSYANIKDVDFQFVKGDILDSSLLNEIFNTNQFDYVFHLAAHFANQNSIDHPIQDLSVNASGTIALLENIRKTQRKIKRFTYTSTSCIYLHSDELLDEENSLHFETPYAISKYFGEEYLRFYASYYGMKVSIVRLFNSYGPGEVSGKYRNVISNFIDLALKDKPIIIFGTGEETRSFTYVDDIISGIISVSKLKTNELILLNLGGKREVKIKELAKLIINLTGSKSEIHYKERRDWDKTLRRRPDISKAKEIIGFNPQTDIKEGLIKTINWFLEQRDKGKTDEIKE